MALVGESILGPGEAEYFDVVLRGGVSYYVYVDPDEPGVDFNLFIYDERGNLVEKDASPNRDALCLVTPLWTGPFRLVVKSERGLSSYHIRVED